MADESPSLFIDEDWKARAQREKEELQQRVAAESAAKASRPVSPLAGLTPESEPAADASVAPAEGVEEGAYEEPYEASFGALLSSLATQAMFALGLIAPPGSEQVMVNLDQAKFAIDTLFVLREKTQGNLTPDEQAALDEALNELQRLFVARVRQLETQAMRQAGIDPNNLKGELK